LTSHGVHTEKNNENPIAKTNRNIKTKNEEIRNITYLCFFIHLFLLVEESCHNEKTSSLQFIVDYAL